MTLERRLNCRSSACSLSPRDWRPTMLRREDLRAASSAPSLRFAVAADAAAAVGWAGISRQQPRAWRYTVYAVRRTACSKLR